MFSETLINRLVTPIFSAVFGEAKNRNSTLCKDKDLMTGNNSDNKEGSDKLVSLKPHNKVVPVRLTIRQGDKKVVEADRNGKLSYSSTWIVYNRY